MLYVCQRDNSVARLLLSSVFSAIYREKESLKPERECKEVTAKISQCLNRMLEESTHYFPPFIACVLVST